MINETLKNVSVLGAAGKMGSGIALLLLQEMARVEAELTGFAEPRDYHLLLLDANPDGLNALKPYLRDHLTKYAERNINLLRTYFALNPDLVSNKEIVDYFVMQAMDLVQFDTEISKARQAELVFEAIVEDVDIKCNVLNAIATHSTKKTYFFSNTSSIPIHVLNEKGELHNRVVGFHFYNPPAVQKLVELIVPKTTDPILVALSRDLAKRLNKTVVPSKDVAGFIGNGFFIREMMVACEKVRVLSRVHTLKEAIYMVNRVTQDFLIRPMGIFQLMDYVGIDVCQRICSIMSAYLPDELFQDPLIDSLVVDGILGGQYSDGSQKDGFFQYEGSVRKGIYAPLEHRYVPLVDNNWTGKLDKELGALPDGHASWKHLQKDPNKNEKLKSYFKHLQSAESQGADLAREFLANSQEIALKLVQQGVAQRLEDVTTVLKDGFFHLYGPDASWINFAGAKR
jgi:3-hydroxyacyl-CoA dehydrogenase